MRVLRVDGGATKNDLLMQLQVCVWGGAFTVGVQSLTGFRVSLAAMPTLMLCA